MVDSSGKRVRAAIALRFMDDSRKRDFIRLRQVVEHLVGNAAKFTAEGHIDLGYTLSSDEENVRIFVADTGCGIASDQNEKIFERFYKVDNFVQGAGLGLSICRTIAERLGGRITLSSKLNEGARFTLKLPIKETDHKTE